MSRRVLRGRAGPLDVGDGVAESIARPFQLVEAAEGALLNFLLDRLGDAATDSSRPA